MKLQLIHSQNITIIQSQNSLDWPFNRLTNAVVLHHVTKRRFRASYLTRDGETRDGGTWACLEVPLLHSSQ